MKNSEFPEISEDYFKDEEDLRNRLQMHEGSKILLYRFVGLLTYLNIPHHNYKLSMTADPFDLIILSFRFVTMADHDGLLALLDFILEQEKDGIKIVIVGIKKGLHRKIEAIKGLKGEFGKRSWNALLKKIETGQLAS